MPLRTTIALLTAALLTIATADAQQYRIIPREVLDSVANPVADARSPMHFRQTRIDAGTIGEDDKPSSYTFSWRNDGEEPLVITAVRTGCGCVTAAYDKRPVKTGEEAEITLTYDPKGHPGHFSRKISVYTQALKQPSAVLELTGRVEPSARPTHNYPYAFGPLLLKQTEVRFEGTARAAERIEMMNAGDKPLTISANERMLPPFVRVVCEPQTIEAGAVADIEIAFDPAEVKGRLPQQVPVIIEGVAGASVQRTIYVRLGGHEDGRH